MDRKQAFRVEALPNSRNNNNNMFELMDEMRAVTLSGPLEVENTPRGA